MSDDQETFEAYRRKLDKPSCELWVDMEEYIAKRIANRITKRWWEFWK